MVEHPARADSIDVEVIYAEPRCQTVVRLNLPSGSTLQQAIEASGIVDKCPGIDLSKCRVGIYGRLASFEFVLSARDRVEIYRPLLADPKEIRKQRAGTLMNSRRS